MSPLLHCMTEGVGYGKTERLLDYCAENPDERVLYLCHDYENIAEVGVRANAKSIRPYIFQGKGRPDMCRREKGERYVPGCRTCSEYPAPVYRYCPYLQQFETVKVGGPRFVLAPVQCYFLADVGSFDTVIVDEAIEGILFTTFTFSREDFLAMGVEMHESPQIESPEIFPDETPRYCAKNCPLSATCYDFHAGETCAHHGPIHRLYPHVVREPENDEEYFFQRVFTGEHSIVYAAWDFYRGMVTTAAFDFFPLLPVEKLFFASATTTPEIIEKWFFRNYKSAGWDIVITESPRPYLNPVETIESVSGSIRDVETALAEGTYMHLANHYHLPASRLLIVCKERHEPLFRDQFPDSYVDHFPLVGVDRYKDVVEAILVACRFRRPLTVRYLLAAYFSDEMVRAIEQGDIVQAIGRLRPLQNPDRRVICYFDFCHDLFPNTRRKREKDTLKWIERHDPTRSTNELYENALADAEFTGYRHRSDFCRIVRRYRYRHKARLPIPVTGVPVDPAYFCTLNYLSDPLRVSKASLGRQFGRFMGRWQERRENYDPARFVAEEPFFLPTGKQPGGRILVVVDLDGTGDWEAFLEERDLPRTATARTQSGGYHLYYFVDSLVPNSAGLTGTCGFDQVDIRGEGGLVFAPGTRFKGGDPYAWVEGGWDTIRSITTDQLNKAVDVRIAEPTDSGIPAQLVPREKHARKGQKVPIIKKKDAWPPCVQGAWDRVKNNNASGEVGHYARLLLATYLHLLGFDDSVIVGIYRGLSDFDPDITQYQVQSVHGYHAWACSTIARHGLCPGDCKGDKK